MSFNGLDKIKKSISKILNGINELDVEVNSYKNVVKNAYLPSIAYVNWAVHLAEKGDFGEAEAKLVSSTLMAHQTPEAYIHLGILKIKDRDFESAMNYFTKAIRLDRNSSKAYCFLGNALTEVQDYKEAEKKFKYANKIDPNNSDIFLNWGISLMRQRQLLQAQEKFQQACKLNMSNFAALYFWGIVELELEEIDKAKQKFQLIVSAIPEHSDAQYYLAYINFKEQKYEESIDYALRSLKLNPKKIETYMLVAEIYMHLKNEPECFKYYEKGQNDSRPNYYFFLSWGISLQEFEHYEESKEKFQKAIEIEPENDLGYAYSGVSCYKTQNIDEAIEFFNKALELNPESVASLDYLGQIYLDRGQNIDAIGYFESVLKISAKSVKCYQKIAKAYVADNNPTKAIVYYERALEYQPDEINIYIEYIKLLIDQKDYKQAMRKLRTACKLDDKNIECLNMLFYLNYILAKENLYDYNVEEAIKIAEKIEDEYPDLFGYAKEKRGIVIPVEKQRIAKNKKGNAYLRLRALLV